MLDDTNHGFNILSSDLFSARGRLSWQEYFRFLDHAVLFLAINQTYHIDELFSGSLTVESCGIAWYIAFVDLSCLLGVVHFTASSFKEFLSHTTTVAPHERSIALDRGQFLTSWRPSASCVLREQKKLCNSSCNYPSERSTRSNMPSVRSPVTKCWCLFVRHAVMRCM